MKRGREALLRAQMRCFPCYQLLLSFNILKLDELNSEVLFSQKSLASNSLVDILKIRSDLSSFKVLGYRFVEICDTKFLLRGSQSPVSVSGTGYFRNSPM